MDKSYRVVGQGGVVAQLIFVSAIGPNPSFFLFWGTFIQLWVCSDSDLDLDQGLTICKSYCTLPVPKGPVMIFRRLLSLIAES